MVVQSAIYDRLWTEDYGFLANIGARAPNRQRRYSAAFGTVITHYRVFNPIGLWLIRFHDYTKFHAVWEKFHANGLNKLLLFVLP